MSNKCNYCSAVDTLEHHLYQCLESKKIWDKLEDYIYMVYQCTKIGGKTLIFLGTAKYYEIKGQSINFDQQYEQ